MPDDMMQKDKGYNLTYESNGVQSISPWIFFLV
jgi:hypothetical protein